MIQEPLLLMMVKEASLVMEGGSEESPVGPGRKRSRMEATPMQRALGLLTRREHSKQELSRKLVARGIEANQARDVVAKLAGDGWQSDDRFAELLVRSRASKGYGPLRIRAELATHGLDRDAVATALEAFDGDWTETASDLVRRRFGPGSPGDASWCRKVAEFLIRRGFAHDTVRLVSGDVGD